MQLLHAKCGKHSKKSEKGAARRAGACPPLTVKRGESGLAGRVGTKFRTLKTESRLHGRVFGGAKGGFDGAPECFRKSKSLLMQVSLCFGGPKLCPNSPRQSRLAPLYGKSLPNMQSETRLLTQDIASCKRAGIDAA